MAVHPDMTSPHADLAPHILIVDDEADLRQMVNLCLTQAGYRTSMAANAAEAYLLADEHHFDVIITDVMMPGEDGISFLGKIHTSKPDVPVIIMTGFAQLQMAVNAIKNGAFEFIHKPFDFILLRKVVDKALSYSRLKRMEMRYRCELERTIEQRTLELKEAVDQLTSAKAALLKAAREKSDFMSNISHEMRTPMNGVIGSLELLAESGLNGSQKEYLLLARQAADNMVELVERLLSYNNSGMPGISRQDAMELPVAVEAVAMNHRARFADKGLSFDVQISPDVPRRIYCDADQFARMLDILIGNAFKFTDKGGARLDVGLERMDGSDALIRVTVRDSGVGIPADMLERIFEPFVQVDGSTTRRFGGVGLGLSIARQLAQLLNGHIHVESTPGEGSVFNFVMRATAA